MDIFPSINGFGVAAPHSPETLLARSAPFSHAQSDRSKHPDFWHLVALVCEAVLEVVCVSSLGYIAAKKGLFTGKVQRDMANLNIYFFTPCLIFSKLAAQLTAEKIAELWIIPIILFTQTIISWLAAKCCTRMMKLNKRPHRNFVTAMAVFGNSNSLPLSLVLSLSHTITGLHWNRVPDDNDDDVGARGILYLLVFSQLGQAVRWSWGMNTLLKPMSQYTPAERGEVPLDEENHEPFKDDDDDVYSSESENSAAGSSGSSSESTKNASSSTQTPTETSRPKEVQTNSHHNVENTVSEHGLNSIPTSSSFSGASQMTDDNSKRWHKRLVARVERGVSLVKRRFTDKTTQVASKSFNSIPSPLQKALRAVWFWIYLTVTRFMGCLNVPLAAIIISVAVGSVPNLRAFFYTPGTFINNTVTSAINQLAGVAVPLILFVLGGNLCKSTLPTEDTDDRSIRREKRHMMWCALISRMLIPLLFMAPFLALLAKFTPISILGDPIFIIVCFLLAGAPTALQLAQICQVNDVFVPVISQLLVQSYVVWIFPSTLLLVMLALLVVRWAQE